MQTLVPLVRQGGPEVGGHQALAHATLGGKDGEEQPLRARLRAAGGGSPTRTGEGPGPAYGVPEDRRRHPTRPPRACRRGTRRRARRCPPRRESGSRRAQGGGSCCAPRTPSPPRRSRRAPARRRARSASRRRCSTTRSSGHMDVRCRQGLADELDGSGIPLDHGGHRRPPNASGMMSLAVTPGLSPTFDFAVAERERQVAVAAGVDDPLRLLLVHRDREDGAGDLLGRLLPPSLVVVFADIEVSPTPITSTSGSSSRVTGDSFWVVPSAL